MSQREKVLEELIDAGDVGVNSFWGYRNFIPRMGAIVFALKKDGYVIKSIAQKDHSCQYVLDMEQLKIYEGIYTKPTRIKPLVSQRQISFWQRLFGSAKI